MQIELWYHHAGSRGKIPAFGHTKHIYQSSYGPICDDEVSKKSLTDATTKALAQLGFSADVFMGLFDDAEYTADNKIEFSIKNASNKAEDSVRLRAPKRRGATMSALVGVIMGSKSDWSTLRPTLTSWKNSALPRARWALKLKLLASLPVKQIGRAHV